MDTDRKCEMVQIQLWNGSRDLGEKVEELVENLKKFDVFQAWIKRGQKRQIVCI